MKKALSIILCLSMLMTSFPVSVFAAPVMAPIVGGSSLEAEEMMPETENDAQQEAESAAGNDNLAYDPISGLNIRV